MRPCRLATGDYILYRKVGWFRPKALRDECASDFLIAVQCRPVQGPESIKGRSAGGWSPALRVFAWVGLEDDARTQLHLAWQAVFLRRADVAETARGRAGDRGRIEGGVVEEIECLKAQLKEAALSEVELLEQ